VGFIRSLLGVLDKKKRLEPSLAETFAQDERMVFDFIEKKVLDEEDLQYFDLFYDISEKSSANRDLYLTRIFHNGKVNTCILKLYFKFFEADFNIFLSELEKHKKDVTFLKRIIAAVKNVELPVALKVLEMLFQDGLPAIKLESARAMQHMQKMQLFNEKFVLDNLLSSDMYLRKELLLIVLSDVNMRNRAIMKLFSVNNILWFKNDLILENIKLCGVLDIKEAADVLAKISADRWFFHNDLAKMAQGVLRKWK